MTINVNRSVSGLIQEEIQNGHFHSLDEIIVEGRPGLTRKAPVETDRVGTTAKGGPRRTRLRQDRAIPLGGISIKELIHEGHPL